LATSGYGRACSAAPSGDSAATPGRQALAGAWAQFWAHSSPSRAVHWWSPGSCLRCSRMVADAGERWSALLESVLGASPREFESRILRHADQARRVRSDTSHLWPMTCWSHFWSHSTPPEWDVMSSAPDSRFSQLLDNSSEPRVLIVRIRHLSDIRVDAWGGRLGRTRRRPHEHPRRSACGTHREQGRHTAQTPGTG
jgi:hypothetical protein